MLPEGDSWLYDVKRNQEPEKEDENKITNKNETATQSHNTIAEEDVDDTEAYNTITEKALNIWTDIAKKSKTDEVDVLRNLKNGESVLTSNLAKWRNRATYGKPERAFGQEVSQEYKSWFVEQMERFRVELPEDLMCEVNKEAKEILLIMKSKYTQVLGEEDVLVGHTSARIKEITQNSCE